MNRTNELYITSISLSIVCNLTAEEVDRVIGDNVLYRNTSPSIKAILNSTTTTYLLNSGTDINVI